jgi:uncharacterized repeat protein (TIGR02543 family)
MNSNQPALSLENIQGSSFQLPRQFTTTLLLLTVWFILGSCGKLSAGGLTLITHGFRPVSEVENLTWLNAMTNYVHDKTGNTGAVYEVVIDRVGGALRVNTPLLIAGSKLDSGLNTTGEVIIKLNWTVVAATDLIGLEAKTGDIAQEVVSMLLNWNDGPSPLVGPIQLIGHSRGGSVVCEIARLLGTHGIWTDHLTMLDPRPVTPLGDAGAVVWETVNFADNYFQNLIALAPWGLDVKNAYSLNLSNRLSGRGYVGNYSGLHSNVHLWYHGSLNTELGASNGDEDGNNNQIYFSMEMRQVWYPGSDSLGTQTGYYLSRLGGGFRNRSSTKFQSGLAAHAYGGALNREWLNPRFPATRTWPSIISTDTKFSTSTGPFTTEVQYQDSDSACTITVKLDNDRNPNNNLFDFVLAPWRIVKSVNIPKPSEDSKGSVFKVNPALIWTNTNVPTGDYWVNTEINDGQHTRSFYSQTKIAITNTGAPPTTVTAPATPSNLQAVALSTSSISLSWLDNSNNETAFRIQRRLGSGGTWAAPTGQTMDKAAGTQSLTDDKGLSAGTPYQYRVAAINSANTANPVYSDVVSATTQAPVGTNYTLNLNSVNPSSGISMSSFVGSGSFVTAATPGSRSFSAGTTVTVTCPQTLVGGAVFQKWQLDGADYDFDTMAIVSMNGPRTLTAFFGTSAPPVRTLSSLAVSGPTSVNELSSAQFTATATFSDGSSQTVTLSPWNLNFGAAATISSAGVLNAAAVTVDTLVTVSATYVSGGVTKYATRDVTVRNTTVTETYTLTTPTPTNGSITRSPNLPSYTAGSQVVVTATPNQGYYLVNWTGASTSTATSITLIMDGNKTLAAQFGAGATPGSLIVNISPPEVVTAGAQWQFEEYFPWNNSGVPATPPYNGEFRPRFKDIPGWTKPSIAFVQVTHGNTATLNVSYTQHLGSLQVVLQPTDAITAGAQWRVDGGAWQNNGVSMNVAPGSRTVEFKPAGTWNPPATQTINVLANQAAIATGSYGPPLGQSVIASISPPNGPLVGGTAVTIEGVNFGSTPIVQFGGVNATTVVVNSSSSITAFTPASDAYVTVPVSVKVGSQTATVANGFNYAVPRGDGIEFVSQIGGVNQAIKIQGNYAYIGEGNSLVVMDISNSNAPSAVGRISLPGVVNGLALSGSYAYVAADDGGLQVVDISTPTAPAIRAYYLTDGIANKVALFGGRAYVAAGSAGLQIINVTNPLRPTRAGFYDTPGNALDIDMLSGSGGVFALVADSGNLQIINVSNPSIPTLASAIAVNGPVRTIAVSGSYAFTNNANDYLLQSINVSNPTSPILAGSDSAGDISGLAVLGSKVYAARGSSGIRIFDITNPAVPVWLGTQLTGVGTGNSHGLAVKGSKTFAVGDFGLQVLDTSPNDDYQVVGRYSPSIGRATSITNSGTILYAGDYFGALRIVNAANPAIPSYLGGYSFGAGAVDGVAVQGTTVSVARGSETSILNCANPVSPQKTAAIPQTTIYPSGMAINGTNLFVGGIKITGAGGWLGAFDISNLSSPSQRSLTDLQGSSNSVLPLGLSMIGNRLFMSTGQSSMWFSIWDVSNPASPIRRSLLSGPDYGLDVSTSTDGVYAYVATSTGLSVIDCTNDSAPVVVGSVGLGQPCKSCCTIGSNVIVASFGKGVFVVDVSAPNLPRVTASFDTVYSAYDVAASGDMIYVADTSSGVQILRMTDKAPPTVVITNPVFDPTFTSTNATLTLAGSASDNKGIAKVFWANSRGGSGEAVGTTDWNTGSVQLYPGQNVITVTAMDSSGNRSGDALTVTYSPPDSTAPVVRVAGNTAGVERSVNTASVDVSGSSNDNVGVVEVTWVNNRGGSGTATGTNPWTVTALPLAPGANVLTFTARDVANNTATDSVTYRYAPPDTAAPSLAIQFPTLDSTFTTTSTPLSLAGMAADDQGVSQVVWMNERGGQGTATGTDSFSAAGIVLQPGLNVIRVTARDAGGNTSMDTLNVTYSPVTVANRPTIAIAAPAANARVEVMPLEIRGSAVARQGLAAVFYQLNDGPWMTATGGALWTVSLTPTAGLNVIRVKSLDAFGVESLVVTRSFTRVVRSDLALTVLGQGAVKNGGFTSPVGLEIGKNYTLTATPKTGWVFEGWSGGLVSSNPTITFTMQDSLAVTATFVENPFSAVAGAYLGLARAESDTHATSGLLRSTVTTAGGFSGSLQLGGKGYRLSGKFDSNGQWVGQIARSKQVPLSVLLMLDLAGGSDTLTGLVSDGSFTSAINTDRATFKAITNTAPSAGRYTFAIEPEAGDTTSPVGYGAGTLLVNAAGKAILTGRLADTTAITFTSQVSKNGRWPLHVLLYTSTGSITGEMLFADLPDSDSAGGLYWFKPARPRDAFFKNGFDTKPSLLAQRFTPSAKNIRILTGWDTSSGAGMLTVSSVDLSSVLAQPVTWTIANLIQSDRSILPSLTMTPVVSTGLFSGSFLHPTTRKSMPFSGALLQKTQESLGWLQGATSTGSVKLEKAPAP